MSLNTRIMWSSRVAWVLFLLGVILAVIIISVGGFLLYATIRAYWGEWGIFTWITVLYLLLIATWSLSAIGILAAALRGPRVSVDGKGVTVRPLWFRDRFTPWHGVAEIKMTVATLTPLRRNVRVLLLSRYVIPSPPAKPGMPPGVTAGDPLSSFDLAVLRMMRMKKHPDAAYCHIAADMSRIDAPTDAILGQIASVAPAHVRIVRAPAAQGT